MEFTRIINYLSHEIWRVQTGELSRSRGLFIRAIRIFLLTVRGVTEDRCLLRASALTYYSLLSIVPVVAMIFGIGKGFGVEKNLHSVLYERFAGQEQVIDQVVKFSDSLLQNVKGGLVAGIGLLFLFYTIIKILSHIENAFNDIWGIHKARNIGRKITDYLSLLLISPLLFIMASAMTVVVRTGAEMIIEKIDLLGVLSPLIFLTIKIVPYIVIWILFSFIYIFMPNIKVNFRSGILAGVIAGTIYELFLWLYLHFQIGVANYNAIYGSFAAMPLFCVWLQISWIIVLFGAEIAFAHQSVEMYEFEQDVSNVSYSYKRLLSLRIVHLLVDDFSNGENKMTAYDLAHELEMPIRMVNSILYELTMCGIVLEANSDDDKSVIFLPARDPNKLTIKFIIDALDGYGSVNIPVNRTEELERIEASLKSFDELIRESPSNKPIIEI